MVTITLNYSKKKINSFLVALLLIANSLTWMMAIPSPLALILIFIFALVLIVNKSDVLSKLVCVLPLILFISFFFVVSLMQNSISEVLEEYFIHFLVLGVPSLIIGQLDFELHRMLKTIVVFSFILLPTLISLDLGNPAESKVDYGFWMGVSYGVVPYVIAAMILYLLEDSKKWRVVSLVSFVIYVFYQLLFGSRGALLSVVVAVFFSLPIFFKFNKVKITKYLFFSICALFFLIYFFKSFLFSINDIADSLGLNLHFVGKLLRMIESDSLSNGRDVLFSNGLNMFLKSPIWGNGIASFEFIYDRYVHNFIIQFLLEGGILLFIPFFIIILSSLKLIMKVSIPVIIRYTIVFLFSISIIELSFSTVVWKSQTFWFFIGVVYNILILRKLKHGYHR